MQLFPRVSHKLLSMQGACSTKPVSPLLCSSMRLVSDGEGHRLVTYGDGCHSSSTWGVTCAVSVTLSRISAGRLFFLVLGSGGSRSGRLFFLHSSKWRCACWWEQCWRTTGSSRFVWLSPATVCETKDIAYSASRLYARSYLSDPIWALLESVTPLLAGEVWIL